MGKIIVLAEKPSVARELARVLGCKRKNQGYIAGEKYIVTWALGHLVTLAEPEVYNEIYKKWSFETLPMLPEKMKLKVIPETSAQYKVVKSLLLAKDTDSVIIATDSGREGELVARWILEKAGYKGAILRLWISSQTDKAIKDGFANLKDGKQYDNLCNAAKSRAEADWLVGLNVTRALTCRHRVQLSAGRVQTPTLAIIVERENEIKSFKPKDYYNLNADFGAFSALYKDKDSQSAIFDKSIVEKLCNSLKGKSFTVQDIKDTVKKVPSPLLYDLTELQRDANKLYKLSPKETLSIMQRLYETHKALTYPRTDSRYLTEDIVDTLQDRVRAVCIEPFSATSKDILINTRKISKACINNAKVNDHHAIIPTEQRADLSSFSTDEKKIYFLVVGRFLSCFYPEYIYKSVKAELECDGNHFYVSGKEIVDYGWKKLGITDEEETEKDETESCAALPKMSVGQKFICKALKIKDCKTSPPSRYTEASLLSAMENPAKFIKDKKMKEYIGAGLGTPATRADIIEKLYSTFYIEKKDNVIYPTSKGMQVIKIVPPELKEPLLTANWEMQLEKIANGNAKKKEFISEIREYTKTLVNDVKQSSVEFVHDNVTRTPCPVCSAMLLAVNGKNGKMLVCPNRECSYRETVSQKTNARCPTCHKQLELVGSGDKKIFVCSCGYREKASERNKKSESVSKHFVDSYLKNQSKSEPKAESPLALAMKKTMEEKNKK